jgi:hypothetical protein
MKPGDVAALPTSLGYAYGRRHRNASLAVFDIPPTAAPLELGQLKEAKPAIACFVEYCEPIDHPDWIYLGKWEFASEEESESPAVYIEDVISPGVYRILERGRMRPATKDEIVGLEKHVLIFPEHVRERIEKHFAGRTARP